jgi:hypothetical protein
VAEREFTINLTQDQALVLSDWLDRVIGTAEFDDLVGEDRAGLVTATPDRRDTGDLTG